MSNEWTLTEGTNPARGKHWVVFHDGARVGSAPTKAGAERLVREMKKMVKPA